MALCPAPTRPNVRRYTSEASRVGAQRARPVLSRWREFHAYDVTRDDQRFVFLQPIGASQAGIEGPPDLVRLDNWFTELRERQRP
jgi:hypothetical protein